MQFLRGIEDWGRTSAMGALAWGLSPHEVSAREASDYIRESPSSKILLIGIYQHMGQFLCATPLIRSLKNAWPHASFHFLGNPSNKAAAGMNPHLDRVWTWKKSSLLEWPAQIQALRKEHFDLALLLTTERPSATGVLLSRRFGAKWVAGYLPSIPERWAEDVAALYHIRIPYQGKVNEVEKYLGLAQAFGVPTSDRRPELVPTSADVASARDIFSKLNLPAQGPKVGLFIGGKAERTDRLWPVESFVKLAHSLKASGFQVIVLSPPPPEHQRLNEFRRQAMNSFPVVQESSIGRVAAFLKTLNLLICPDGGILHLASSVGTPTLGLFFSTDPAVWGHDVKQTFLDGRGQPSSDLRPDDVVREVARFLQTPTPS